MSYELWSKISRSIVGAFPTEDGALAAVRDALHLHGRAYAESLAVISEDRRGHSRAIAEGPALVELAFAKVGASDQLSA